MALVAILWYVALLRSTAYGKSGAEKLEVAVVKGDHDFFRALVSDWISEIQLDNDIKLSQAQWEFGRIPVARNVSISSSHQKLAALNVNGLRNGEIKLNTGVHLKIGNLNWENKPDWTLSSEPTRNLFGMFQFEAGALISFINCTIAIQLEGCTNTSELSRSEHISGDVPLESFVESLLTKGSLFSEKSRVTLDEGEVWLHNAKVVCDAGEQSLSHFAEDPTVRDARELWMMLLRKKGGKFPICESIFFRSDDVPQGGVTLEANTTFVSCGDSSAEKSVISFESNQKALIIGEGVALHLEGLVVSSGNDDHALIESSPFDLYYTGFLPPAVEPINGSIAVVRQSQVEYKVCSQSLEVMVEGLLNIKNSVAEPRLRIKEDHSIYIEFLKGEFLSHEGNTFLASVVDVTIICTSQPESEVMVEPDLLDTESQAVEGKNDLGIELTAEDYEGLVDSDILQTWFSSNSPPESPGNEESKAPAGTSVINALTTWWALGIICVGSFLLPVIVKLARRRRYITASPPSETTPGPHATSDFEDGGAMNYDYVYNRITSENSRKKIGFIPSRRITSKKDRNAQRFSSNRIQRFRRTPVSGRALSFVYSLRHDSLTKILAKKRQRRAEMKRRLVSPKITHALRAGTIILPAPKGDLDQRRHNMFSGAKSKKIEGNSNNPRKERVAAHCASFHSSRGKTEEVLSNSQFESGETKRPRREYQSRPSSRFLSRMESHCQEAVGHMTSDEHEQRRSGEGEESSHYNWIVEANSSPRHGDGSTEENQSPSGALLASVAVTFGSRLSLDECRTCISGNRRILRLADGDQKSYLDIFGVLENAIGKEDRKDNLSSSEDSHSDIACPPSTSQRNETSQATRWPSNPEGHSAITLFKPSVLRKALSNDTGLFQLVRGGLTFAKGVGGKLLDRFWDRTDSWNNGH